MTELIIDNFAGGGGASTGIEMAIGRSVDIAINHDKAAIDMHKTNHPDTKHYCESVWEVDPLEATGGKPVALTWFSPSCQHFSKAKGAAMLDSKIRGLAWAALRWAAKVNPRVIMLENVEEFQTWGPLDSSGKAIPYKKGVFFRNFIKQLKEKGYDVEYKVLKACDYGVPTIRKRFFMVARCDGKPIVFPQATHGPRKSQDVKSGKLKPYIPAKDIIDLGISGQSIFERDKPLSEATMRRIGNGLKKYCFCDEPSFETKDFMIQVGYGDPEGKRVLDLEKPIGTVTAGGNKFGLVTCFLTQQFKSSIGQSLEEPLNSITTVNKAGLVTAFLVKYYGNDKNGQSLDEPLHTITTKDRFALVEVKGVKYEVKDITLRMLQPRELYRAHNFPEDYKIDKYYDGRKVTKKEQLAKVGNSVPPTMSEVLVRANLPEYCRRSEGENR